MVLALVIIFFVIVLIIGVYKVCKERREEAEKERVAEATRKVNALIKKYTMMSINDNRNEVQFPIAPELVNKEVVFTVNSYKENTAAIYDRYLAITNEVKSILDRGAASVNAKYAYLTANEDKLKRLKTEGESCLARLASYKIEMLNEDQDLLFEMKLAFGYLLNSLKSNSESLTVKKFITSDKPSDLALFEYENDPVILLWEHYYFCLFSNVILVFDEQGAFATAIDPSALKIMIERKIIPISVINGIVETNQYIADDSKCISQGSTKSTWRYTRRDGSPDRRYSFNPRLEYRTDTYEYVIVEFILEDRKVAFSASSEAIADAFEKVIPNYSRKCNNRHNPTPEFLMLLRQLEGENSTQVESMIQACDARSDTKHYFCKLIGEDNAPIESGAQAGNARSSANGYSCKLIAS